MSQDLQQARYDQLVRRVGALYGGGSKVTEVLAELFPVLEVENTTPELLALTGWRTAWQSTEQPPTVAEVSASQLRNPVGSGQLIAVTRIDLRSTTSTMVQAEISTATFGTPIPGLFRDSRFGTPRQTTAQVASATNVVIGGGLRIRLESADNHSLRDDNGIVVLTPGTNLDIGTTVTNLTFTVTYWWRERIAQQSEILFP